MPTSPRRWRIWRGIALPAKGKLTGRVAGEALAGGAAVTVVRRTIVSDPGANGRIRTMLNLQQLWAIPAISTRRALMGAPSG